MAAPTATNMRDELEGYGIDSTILSDGWIERCRDEFVIPWIKNKTRMNFDGIATVTEYYNGNGTTTLMLNRRPVVAIVKAEWLEGLVLRDLTQSIEVIQDEGMLKARSILLTSRQGTFFTRGYKNWKIEYTYGYADYPSDVFRAIKLMVCAKMLGQVGARTGGGSVSVQSHGRNYGMHGKYTDIRKEFVAEAMSLLRSYMTGVTGS